MTTAVPLATRSLSKDYPPVRVVDDISLEFRAGTIHALLGENGAGKSTLIAMLSGARHATEGHVLVDGQPVVFRNVAQAQAAGVVALPQELLLVGTLGAAENIYLGQARSGYRTLVDRRRISRDARDVLAGLGQHFDVNIPTAELSPVQQTMVAIARALVREARVLVLDEPTAALTDTETGQLFDVLRALRDQGTAIIYVSHRLEEVFALADEVTVMRNGRHVWTRPVSDTDTESVVAAMIGRDADHAFPPRTATGEHVVLEASGLRGRTVDGVDIQVRAGQVLGIAGLAGSGRSELLRIIAGAQQASAGTVVIDGRDVSGQRLSRRLQAGLGYVPEERRSQGLVMLQSIATNIALPSLRRLSRMRVMQPRVEKELAASMVNDLQIRATSVQQPVAELSGGNQQKVVLAKYLARTPRLLLLDEPTRGIDVGTKAEIYQLIRDLADDGVAIVMVSSEIPELLGMADEIAVLNRGRLTGLVAAEGSDEESVLKLCYQEQG